MTVHGLRRTFITTGRKLKLFEDTERLTNHLDNSVTGRHYDGTSIDDLRQSLQNTPCPSMFFLVFRATYCNHNMNKALEHRNTWNTRKTTTAYFFQSKEA